MSYERVGKEALYFSKEEIELLRSCVGKEVTSVSGYALSKEKSVWSGLECLSLKFSDGTLLTVNNELADMPYFPGEGDETYVEGGNFHLSPDKPFVSENNWHSYPFTHDDLPVPFIVRRAYVINQSLAYHSTAPDNTVHSFTHTSGIILVFWDGDENISDAPYYMIVQQSRNNTDYISFDIAYNTDRHIKVSMYEWNAPDLYSTSIIRVG